MVTAWTGSGKAALLNGDYLRFSPQWVFHQKTLEPLGLPCNLGGLVNRAAFKTIAPIARAGNAVQTWSPGHRLLGSVGTEALPHFGIVAAAKAMRQTNPDRFSTDSQALAAYLRTPAGDQEYRAYRRAVISGDSPLAQIQVSTP
jgi:hypothetical protein